MTKRYAVHNLRCAGCAARIEDAIAGLPGVKSAAINLDSARLRVEGEQPELAAMIRLADAIEPGTLFSEMDENEPLPESSEPQPSLFRSEYKLWIAAALFAVGMIFEERLDALLTPFVAKAVFFGIPYLLCGLSVLKKGLQSLLKFDFFNEYTLMGRRNHRGCGHRPTARGRGRHAVLLHRRSLAGSRGGQLAALHPGAAGGPAHSGASN